SSHSTAHTKRRRSSSCGLRRLAGPGLGRKSRALRENFPTRRRRGVSGRRGARPTPVAHSLPRPAETVMLVAATDVERVGLLPWEPQVDVRKGRLRGRALALAMAASVAAVAVLAYWDAARESTSALQDFAEEQRTVAAALAAALRARSDL